MCFDLVCPQNRYFHKKLAYDLKKLVLCNMDIFLLNQKDLDTETILHRKICNMHIAPVSITHIILLEGNLPKAQQPLLTTSQPTNRRGIKI
jgi:hypothetical protein